MTQKGCLYTEILLRQGSLLYMKLHSMAPPSPFESFTASKGSNHYPPKSSSLLGKLFGVAIRAFTGPLVYWFVIFENQFIGHNYAGLNVVFGSQTIESSLNFAPFTLNEPSRKKTNVVSEQVRHKPGCTSTEDG